MSEQVEQVKQEAPTEKQQALLKLYEIIELCGLLDGCKKPSKISGISLTIIEKSLDVQKFIMENICANKN